MVELNEFTRSKIEEILIAINDRKAMALVTFFRREDILTKLYKWGCEIWDVDYVTNLLQNAIETPMFKVQREIFICYKDEGVGVN